MYKRDLAKEKEKEKKRKHFISRLRLCLPSASPMPVSLPPLISAPSILFPHRTPLLCTSSILPLFSPACSSRNIKETETYMKNKLYILKTQDFSVSPLLLRALRFSIYFFYYLFFFFLFYFYFFFSFFFPVV
jgi:hypothetical protein